jgi:NRPS condensation-like uncharacterized protein
MTQEYGSTQEQPEIDYHALERRNFPPSAFPLKLVMPEPRVHCSKRSPVLTVLATFIADGLLLTLNGHHSVMDGARITTLVKTLGKHVAAVSQGRFLSSEEAFQKKHSTGQTYMEVAVVFKSAIFQTTV